MKKILAFCFSLVLTAAFCLPILTKVAMAVDCNDPDNFKDAACSATGILGTAGTGAGYETDATKASLSSIVGSVIKAGLALIGVIFLLLTVYAGFLWMTARGEEDKVKEAKNILKNGLIGLVISLAAYAITNYVVTKLVTSTTS